MVMIMVMAMMVVMMELMAIRWCDDDGEEDEDNYKYWHGTSYVPDIVLSILLNYFL